MIRRKFLQLATLVGAGGLQGLAASQNKTVTYHIEGFTCVTCAVGLDTLLERQKGVVTSKSSYPNATTIIVFHPDLVTEADLRTAIAEMGFHAA